MSLTKAIYIPCSPLHFMRVSIIMTFPRRREIIYVYVPFLLVHVINSFIVFVILCWHV